MARGRGARAGPGDPTLALAGAVGLVLALATPAYAHIVSDHEVRLLRAMPHGLVARAAHADLPDATGAVGLNRGGFRDVVDQRGALLLFMDAAARGDSTAAEHAWKAIDVAFAHQTPAGDFQPDAHDRIPRDTSFAHVTGRVVWLADLCRAEVVVLNSPLAERFRFRVALMLPKLRRSIDALAADANLLEHLHARQPDRELVDAATFLLADGIYHEPLFNQLGSRFLTPALAAQRKNGAFATLRDPSVEEQGRALWSLLAITTYFPAPSLQDASVRASRWLGEALQRTRDARSGTAARAAARDAIIALAYQARYAEDDRAAATAARIADRWFP